MRALLTTIACALLCSACIPLPGNRSLSRRTVFGKQGENTLVADDGASCRVTADAFARVQIGDDHTCAWKEVNADGTGRTVPDTRPGRTTLPGRPGRP
jgi:hypothetical protein